MYNRAVRRLEINGG